MELIRAIFNAIFTFLLPPRCPICGVIVAADDQFCLSCWQQLDFISEPWCAKCAAPFAFARPDDMVCATCLVKPPHHDGVRAAVRYDQQSAQVALQLKYGAKLGNARLIARHLRRFGEDPNPSTIIIPVPLHRWRLWSRGFNQSILIANRLAQHWSLAVRLDLIFRIKSTPPLRTMSAKQRKKTVAKAFKLSPHAAASLTDRTVWLVDDIYTTGSTANACAKLLKRAGAKQVLVFCWARVVKETATT